MDVFGFAERGVSLLGDVIFVNVFPGGKGFSRFLWGGVFPNEAEIVGAGGGEGGGVVELFGPEALFDENGEVIFADGLDAAVVFISAFNEDEEAMAKVVGQGAEVGAVGVRGDDGVASGRKDDGVGVVK